MKNKILYHGTDHQIEKPVLDGGKATNDYGKGFYCTEHYELACEWAAKVKGRPAVVNKYELRGTGLKVLDLSSSKYNILNWMVLLLKNRTFTLTSPISVEAKKYLLENFDVDVTGFDVIKGYRADDSYFSFAEDFLNNTISVQKLAKAMKLGKLGIQIVLISEKAFSQLRFIESQDVDNLKYFSAYDKRDKKARAKYVEERANMQMDENELYMIDILRGGIKNGDPRI